MQRRPHSTREKGEDAHTHEHEHAHEHEHGEHGHDHKHGLFTAHSHEDHAQEAEQLITALQRGDRGSRITIIGLLSNIGLTAVKGVAGWAMHSANAGHSLSDLLGDFVVLICWRLSRKPSSERYPFGYAKWESVGTTTVSLLLIGGALGIGFHSYHLLLHALSDAAATMPAGPLHTMLVNVTAVAPDVPEILVEEHTHGVDVNAAWFAGLSIAAKEVLYRATKKVALEEQSPVLLANAVHHRSDVYGSAVALFAILGSWVWPALPLDPLGGLLVSIVILKQGFDLLVGSWNDLIDRGVSPSTRNSLRKSLEPLMVSRATTDSEIAALLDIKDIRARRAGSVMYVDLTAVVPGSTTISGAASLEDKITETLRKAKKEVTDVRVRFEPEERARQS
ncbi:cation efflux protein [Schizophyllum commune Tattone D]|nr:cation efflux protein [Schizophyllum commune Loenen D]KAI5825735.1 cation efflux protein [Schizophyllum commune Tattone D]